MNWLIKVYKYDEEQTDHIVVRGASTDEAERTLRATDVFRWSVKELTPREDVWAQLVEKLVEILRESYYGMITAYTTLDHGWDSLDAIEMVIEIEDAFKVQVGDDFLGKLTLGDLTPVQVAQAAVDLMTDDQVTRFLRHVEQGPKLDKADLEINLEVKP